jgi:hypothetical protein
LGLSDRPASFAPFHNPSFCESDLLRSLVVDVAHPAVRFHQLDPDAS